LKFSLLFSGKAAYFKDEGKQSTIYGSDHTLYELLKYKNSSINENTTYADIYYVSIVDVSALSMSNITHSASIYLLYTNILTIHQYTYSAPIYLLYTNILTIHQYTNYTLIY